MAKRPQKFKQVPENRPYKMTPDRETGRDFPKKVGAREEVSRDWHPENVPERRKGAVEKTPDQERQGGRDTGKDYK